MSKFIPPQSALNLIELLSKLSAEAGRLAIMVKENPALGFNTARLAQDDFADILGEIDEILFSEAEGFL